MSFAPDAIVIVAVLAGTFLVGVFALGIAAARIDDAHRLATLLRETRRLRLARVGLAPSPRAPRRRF
jgi:hypothetical protein